jgi:hypothetical protein
VTDEEKLRQVLELRVQLTESTQTLWRHVSKGFLNDQGRVTSQSFMFYPRDHGLMSIARTLDSTGQAVDAEEAWNRQAKRLVASNPPRMAPVGVLSIAIGDVQATKLKDGVTSAGLTVWDDSAADGTPEEHGHIDGRAVLNDWKQHNAVAAQLKAKAAEYGWAYLPPGVAEPPSL